MNTLVEIAALKQLLQREKEADLEQHRILLKQMPLPERVQEGYAWYPLEVRKRGYTLGERAFVIVERTQKDHPHRFRAGNTVNFFTQQAAVRQPERTGILQFVDRNRMKIVFNAKDLPDWLGMGQLGVELTFDERTYHEMEKALHALTEAHGDRLAELREILLGQQPAALRPDASTFTSELLNDSQQTAVRSIVAARDVAVIHGPPGTGKTTTLVAAIGELVKREAQILVCAPSNTAVDLLTARIAEAGIAVVRIGNISRIDEDVLQHTLEMQISQHPESKNIKKVRQQAAEARRKAQRYRRKFGHEEASERRALYKEAGELSAWASQLEDRIIAQLLDGAQVIAATLVGANHPVLGTRTFTTAVIDEAAQALEPATWIPILRASRVVLAGDPHQLPPTVKDFGAARDGLDKTLLEKHLTRTEQGTLLNVQYRMHSLIMQFSNDWFYGGRLQAAPAVADHQLAAGDRTAVVFIDTAGSGYGEQVRENLRSRFNPDEWQIIREDLYQLLEDHVGLELPSLALISPYREQAELMKREVAEDDRLAAAPIAVNTIDGFQGQERDVVYISLVRSNEKGEIGFLKDYRRMNVAMTRARKRLVVIGDSATIGNDAFYLAFLQYVEKAGSYRTVWEYMR